MTAVIPSRLGAPSRPARPAANTVALAAVLGSPVLRCLRSHGGTCAPPEAVEEAPALPSAPAEAHA